MTAFPSPQPDLPSDLLVLDGYLDDQTLPDEILGAPVRFQLVVSPTEDRVDELVLPCTVTQSELAHAIVNELGASDLLRVSGRIRLPQTPGDVLQLDVTAIEVLDTGVDLASVSTDDEIGPAELSEHGFVERTGHYQVWHDPDAGLSSIWHTSGTWLDSTDDPSELGTVIEVFEQRRTPKAE
ncbi:hypothetical protein [Streptomyces sp. 039-1]|uniref:hypothetical protein n=1 Tax=Streptomyces sp. 039-1 TaxID=2789263 RepID=UPI0039F4987A